MDYTTIISFPCLIDGFESRVMVEDTLRLSPKEGINGDVIELEVLRQRKKGQIYNDPGELFNAPDDKLIGTDCFPPKMWIFPEKKYMVAFAGSRANPVKLQTEFQQRYAYANLDLDTIDGRKQFLDKVDINAHQLLTYIANAMMAAEQDTLKRIVRSKPEDAKELMQYVQSNGVGIALFATTENLPARDGVCAKCRSCTCFPCSSPPNTHLYKIRPIYSISVDQLLQTEPEKIQFIQLNYERYELTRVHDKFLIYGVGENSPINLGRKGVFETLSVSGKEKEVSNLCYEIMSEIYWQQGDFKLINPRIEGGILSTNPAVKRIIPLQRPRWFEGPLNMLKQLKEWVLARLFPNPRDLDCIISYEIPPYKPREGPP